MSVFVCFFGNSRISRLVSQGKKKRKKKVLSRFLVWSISLFESAKDTTEVFEIAASAYSTLLLVQDPPQNTAYSSAAPKN